MRLKGSLENSGPKHSTFVPFKLSTALKLNEAIKLVAPVVPNPLCGITLNGVPVSPQGAGAEFVLCIKVHSCRARPGALILKMVSPVLPMLVIWQTKRLFRVPSIKSVADAAVGTRENKKTPITVRYIAASPRLAMMSQ